MTTAAREITLSLPIEDRQRSMAFYRDAFGFALVGPPTEDGVPEPLAFRLDDRVLLALIPTEGFGWALGDREVAAPGTSECLVTVSVGSSAEADDLLARVIHAGGSVISELTEQPWGYSGVCADPDGHAWQIHVDPPSPS
ncbi:VOC family protein [Actinoalloteichus spitiensis]|uniref:VOC family protein n=1 Tax=Actinoalloteichus spitiensis TaxID=252394 RepID=UPI00037DA2ED|nr:VOC family protein [Actinoalloteichus spitiensis]